MNGMIEMPIRKATANEQGVIKITPEAFDALLEVQEETGLSARQAASIIITQAVRKNLISYKKED